METKLFTREEVYTMAREWLNDGGIESGLKQFWLQWIMFELITKEKEKIKTGKDVKTSDIKEIEGFLDAHEKAKREKEYVMDTTITFTDKEIKGIARDGVRRMKNSGGKYDGRFLFYLLGQDNKAFKGLHHKISVACGDILAKKDI